MTSSSDEGEILEDDAGNLKATSLPHPSRSGIDRRDRLPKRHSSPDDESTSRYSAQSPRGSKRFHDDADHRDSRHSDTSRQQRPHPDGHRRDDYKRSRVAYDDARQPQSTKSSNYDSDRSRRNRSRDRYRYDDIERDRRGHGAPRNRSRSRSPARRRYGNHGDDRSTKYSQQDQRHRSSRDLDYDDRGSQQSARASDSRDVARSGVQRSENGKSSASNVANSHHRQDSDIRHAPENQPQEPDFVEVEEFDEEAEIERRRKRRGELLSKSSSATPLLLHAVGVATEKARAASPASSTLPGTPQMEQLQMASPQTPGTIASPRSPSSQNELPSGVLDIANDHNMMNELDKGESGDDFGQSAADYDPTIDMQEDERRDELRSAQTKAAVNAPKSIPSVTIEADGKGGGPADENDEDFDMFADDFDEEKYDTADAPAMTAADVDMDAAATTKGGILEGDDKEGYYKMRIGEILNGRYQIQSTLGKGMFSGVVGAIDITTKTPVAIKIMRNNDALRKGGYTEIAILQKLNDADPENKKHIVKFERSFDFRGHLCMAFENLSMNLREVLRKFGNNVGINLPATRTYAYQIFVALAHMQKCSIIHADLKPDNILVNESRNILKICDLGTAIDRSDAATAHTDITPYLVSRFYRAPEIILGMPYDYGVDMWSIGCTLYELYTGKILFTGESNNQMLKTIMEIRGKFTPKNYKRGQLAANHFDELGQFVSVERDRITAKTTVRTLSVVKPIKDLRTRLMAASGGMNENETRDLNHFIDLLDHCLALNPDKRIKPMDALKHPFFTSRSGNNGRR